MKGEGKQRDERDRKERKTKDIGKKVNSLSLIHLLEGSAYLLEWQGKRKRGICNASLFG